RAGRVAAPGGGRHDGRVPSGVRTLRRVPASAELVALGRRHGLDAVGVTAAEPFATTRRHLERRRAAGLHGGMQHTYRRPERSADPTRALPDTRALVLPAPTYRRTPPRQADATGN